MFSCLAAYQSASCLDASVRDALYDGGDLLCVILSYGNVIQKEDGFSADAYNVVDAHCDTVDTDRIVLVDELRDAQLRTYTVSARDQDRLGHPFYLGNESASETSDIRDYTGYIGPLHMFLHETDAFVSGLDVDTGSCV